MFTSLSVFGPEISGRICIVLRDDMLRQLLNRNLYLVLGTDLLVFSLALILSFWIRFDFEPEA
jgi:hypothetical protein